LRIKRERERERERESLFTEYNNRNITHQLLQWQAASGGISPSSWPPVTKNIVHILTEKVQENTKNVQK